MSHLSAQPVSPRIAIIGAGPGGLLAARVLERSGLRPTVYDADESASERNPGGTLDLHADSGQIALDDAGLTAEFANLARPESQAKRLVDPESGEVVKEFLPRAGDIAAPEIDRGQLRDLLANSVSRHTVKWGRRLVSARPGSACRWNLTFADGSTAPTDIVIGADGAWSRVRPLVTDALPGYTGVSFIELVFTDVDSAHPSIARLVGDGHLWANGDGKNIILQRNSNSVVRGYLGIRTELDWMARAGLGDHDGRGGIGLDGNGVQRLEREAVRALLLERFNNFAPALKRLITQSEGALANRPIFALPAPLTWQHRPGVTLIGDAAHVMSPFGGNGVNFALLDAAELARALADAVNAKANSDDAIRSYERSMFTRTGASAVAANEAIVEHFASGGVALESIPDFAEEAERWNANADAYRAARA